MRASWLRESVTYQAILREGVREGVEHERPEQTRRILIRQGTVKFGVPDAHVREMLEAINDLETLEGLSVRLLNVSSWAELLAPVEG